MSTRKVVSFDLQGTLTNSAWSNEFWQELLPQLFSRRYQIPLAEGKQQLGNRFRALTRNDPRYYSFDLWRDELDEHRPLGELFLLLRTRPLFYVEWLTLLKALKRHSVTLVILSATTREFIRAELGEHAVWFAHVFSSLDDFGVSGKPPAVFREMLKRVGGNPDSSFHIGDDELFDLRNPTTIGMGATHFKEQENRKFQIDAFTELLSKGPLSPLPEREL